MSDTGPDETPSAAKTRELEQAREISRMLTAQGKFTRSERTRIAEVLLPDIDARAARRFGIMLALSVGIAVMGLSANSAAVVIGAMLIAPLMNPILSFSAAVGLGLGRRAASAALLVVLGSAGSIALADVLAMLLPDISLGSEILSRTSPDGRDLIVAIAAGAAGSYATARADLSSALPGVAVAVALVPPLATVGITLEAGRNDLAQGALLLFATNLIVIVVTALVVFLLTGVIPTIRLCLRSGRLATIVVASVVAAIAIGIPLTTRSVDAARSAQLTESVAGEVSAWLENRSLDIRDVSIDGFRVVVEVAGPDEPAAAFLLAQALVDDVGEGVTVEVQWSQRELGVARTSEPTVVETSAEDAVAEPINRWLQSASVDGVEFELISVSVDGGDVEIVVGGQVPPPASETLADDVASALGQSASLTIRWLQSLEVDRPDESAEEVVDRLANAWVGTRTSVRVLGVQLHDGQVIVDLATSADPLGIDTLEKLLRDVVGPDSTVLVRSVQLEPVGSSDPSISSLQPA